MPKGGRRYYGEAFADRRWKDALDRIKKKRKNKKKRKAAESFLSEEMERLKQK